MGGALTNSGMQGQNPNGAMIGSAAGTVIGYPAGSLISGKLNNVFNPLYRQEWKDIGTGVSAWVPKSPLPSWAAGAGSGLAQEIAGGVTQKTVEVKK